MTLGKAAACKQDFIALIEKWESATDKGKPFRALLTDLPMNLWLSHT